MLVDKHTDAMLRTVASGGELYDRKRRMLTKAHAVSTLECAKNHLFLDTIKVAYSSTARYD